LPPQGRSAGTLVGINSATLLVNKVTNGDFCVKLNLKSKIDGFEWVLVPVYGAQDDKKPDFFSRTCTLAIMKKVLCLSDEILTFSVVKKIRIMIMSMGVGLYVQRYYRKSRQYTWANRRANPTFEKLDRILGSVDWENKFH
jgi:hypothetical protein